MVKTGLSYSQKTGQNVWSHHSINFYTEQFIKPLRACIILAMLVNSYYPVITQMLS